MRGNYTLGRTSSGGSTAAPATFDPTTGNGVAYRAAVAGDQTFISFPDLDPAGTYLLTLSNGGPGALTIRRTSSGGSIAQNLASGASVTDAQIAMSGATSLVFTCGTNTSSAAFNGLSLRKIG